MFHHSWGADHLMAEAITWLCDGSGASGTFDATRDGVRAAGRSAARMVEALGVQRVAERAERVITVLVSWLAEHEHPDGPIKATIRYSESRRELELRAVDEGSMLPALGDGDVFRAALADAADLHNGASPLVSGREVFAVLRVPRLYTVRYTWSVPEGMQYPAESFEETDSEDHALFAAGWASRPLGAWGGLAVVKVEICRADGPWRVVFSKDEP